MKPKWNPKVVDIVIVSIPLIGAYVWLTVFLWRGAIAQLVGH